MLSLSKWRHLLRIPWIRANRSAVHFLSEAFYLLVVLYRERRFREFHALTRVYFGMIESFAQYGRVEARGTVESLLEIPWMLDRRRDLYRLIAAYKQIVRCIKDEQRNGSTPAIAEEMRGAMIVYVAAFKELIGFDESDEAQIAALRSDPRLIDESLAAILASLDVPPAG